VHSRHQQYPPLFKGARAVIGELAVKQSSAPPNPALQADGRVGRFAPSSARS
jgi:hypothetical protein